MKKRCMTLTSSLPAKFTMDNLDEWGELLPAKKAIEEAFLGKKLSLGVAAIYTAIMAVWDETIVQNFHDALDRVVTIDWRLWLPVIGLMIINLFASFIYRRRMGIKINVEAIGKVLTSSLTFGSIYTAWLIGCVLVHSFADVFLGPFIGNTILLFGFGWVIGNEFVRMTNRLFPQTSFREMVRNWTWFRKFLSGSAGLEELPQPGEDGASEEDLDTILIKRKPKS